MVNVDCGWLWMIEWMIEWMSVKWSMLIIDGYG